MHLLNNFRYNEKRKKFAKGISVSLCTLAALPARDLEPGQSSPGATGGKPQVPLVFYQRGPVTFASGTSEVMGAEMTQSSHSIFL